MQNRISRGNLEKTKKILRNYSKENLEFNEPHFTIKLDREKIDRNEIIRKVLSPEKLSLVGISESKNTEYKIIHDLYFKLSKNRIIKIPVSIKPKSLYLITVFKIRRKIQNEAFKYYQK